MSGAALNILILIFFVGLGQAPANSAEVPPSRAIWEVLSRSQTAERPRSKGAKVAVQPQGRAPWESPEALVIDGWVIPNEMEGGELESFLLSRVPSGCIHVPLPPPGSVIFVRMKPGVKKLSDVSTTLAVRVKGRLTKSGRVDAGFELEAESIEVLPLP